jgi:inward rectifier potassium channel
VASQSQVTIYGLMANTSQYPKIALKRSPSFRPQIRAVGQKRGLHGDLYHTVLGQSWFVLTSMVFAAFILGNFLFSLAYWLVPGSIVNARPGSLLDSFFFSVETMATIGYGEMAPANDYAHAMVTIEAFVGVVAFALVAGITFAKFSRPTAKVLFADKAVVSKRNGVPYLMFRMANWRHNAIVQANLTVTILVDETTTEGEFLRRLVDLPLERKETPFFTLTWTAAHKIDESSPFYGPDALEKLVAKHAEIILAFNGTDERLAQPVHASYSYRMQDIIPDARFADVLTLLPSGVRIIDYRLFHRVILSNSVTAAD